MAIRQPRWILKQLRDADLKVNADDDLARDRTRDCIRATQYRGRTIKHAT